MGGQPDEFVFDILRLFEDTHILLDYQRQRLIGGSLLGVDVLKESRSAWFMGCRPVCLQTLPVREGQRNRIDQDWERVSLGPVNDLLQLQAGLSLQSADGCPC